jgi:hypothetical protein
MQNARIARIKNIKGDGVVRGTASNSWQLKKAGAPAFFQVQ